MPSVARVEQKTKQDDDRKDRWWTADKLSVARKLQSWMNNIERASWARRWKNLTFYRYYTGRPVPPSTYNYASTSRPSAANIYSRARFEAPTYNVLQQCGDALANRVYKERPILKVCPIDGDFKARVKAKKLSRYMDAAFSDLKLWPVIEQCGEDCRIWGSSFLKVDVGIDGKTISATRLLTDEIVIDDNECNAGEPIHIGIRVFVNKQELLERYGDDAEAVDAINRAPKSTNGYYFGGDLDCTDVVVLREAWSLPCGDEKGRHVLSVGDYAFVDEEYDRDHAPIAKLTFKSMSTDYFGMGMPEMVLGLQRSLDRQLAAADENMRRAAWPRIGIATGSNVNEGALGDKSNGIYYYTNTAPQFQFPEAMSPDQHAYIQDTINRIKETFRLNDQLIQGQKPKYTSGKAIDSQNELDDAAHIDLTLHLEDFVIDVGRLIVEAAEVCKPKVTLPGRHIQEIKWDDVKLDQNSYSLRTYSIGRLSGSYADKMQTVADWYAQGFISKADKMRLEQIPDLDGYADLYNASGDYVEMVLDLMVEEGDYQPAEPWVDLSAALEATQSRYLYEKQYKTPQDRLDLLLQFMAQLRELIDEATPAPSPGPAPGFGIQAPPGAPVTPPPAISPAMAPAPQLQAA